jgi:type IV pilus assembly protein PilV
MEDMMSVSKNSQSGFSMVEMLIAIVILAVGLLGLAELQVTAIKTNAHSYGLIAASSVAQMFLEDVISWSEDDNRLDVDANAKTDWNGGSVNVPGAGTFMVTYDVDVDHQNVSGVCKVTVHVANAQVGTVFGRGLKTVTMSTLKRAF